VSEHFGLLGSLFEAFDIKQELGCSADEASELQRRRAAERMKEFEPSNVIVHDFRGARKD
jgi:hypothetical protein